MRNALKRTHIGRAAQRHWPLTLALLLTVVIVAVGLLNGLALAQEDADDPDTETGTSIQGGGEAEPAELGALILPCGVEEDQVCDKGSPLHPPYAVLDAQGRPVIESGQPVSTMQTCGSCHDADFIATHSFHSDVGISQFNASGVPGQRAWETSPGYYGGWNPITYRYLTPPSSGLRQDLTTAAWAMTAGLRHAGGGPALYNAEGQLLSALDPNDPAYALETQIMDPETGELVPWDWQESGVIEMNCFVCHLPVPDHTARLTAISSGEFGWANTATMLQSGIVTQDADGSYVYNPEAFDEDGLLTPDYVHLQDPSAENCGACHGVTHSNAQLALQLDNLTINEWSTLTTGMIFSPQRLSNSGLNIQDKLAQSHSWDIHAERVLSCTDCHYSLNNPVYFQEDPASRPSHLIFDPRRLDLGEYLYRPLHQFAKGSGSVDSALAPELDNSLRRCESCHTIETTHDWLPYKHQHVEAMACESCHIPEVHGPALQAVDWTVLTGPGQARTEYRGVEGGTLDMDNLNTTLLTGYEPVLLPRVNADGTQSLAPHNLVSAWYWAYGDIGAPVPLADLERAWFTEDASYQADLLAAFDADGDGLLLPAELVIDTPAKEQAVKEQLRVLGIENPHIVGEVLPYPINHGTVTGNWATRDCQDCHSEDSRVTAPFVLVSNTPGGVPPSFISGTGGASLMNGTFTPGSGGALFYQPVTRGEAATYYLLGHDLVEIVDLAGILLFFGTLAGVSGHGLLRYLFARRRAKTAGTQGHAELERVYLYTVYERLWHWLQTALIFGLLFTGLVIHRPNTFSIFDFRWVVLVHNVLAAILIINAVLAAFYHFASGEIRQFLPEPRGFFRQSIEQAMFYLRGIFRGDPHPLKKTPERKMNPLQQMTYLAILNVLLPVQIITGALMWGLQEWPQIATSLGGLPVLAPIHTLAAWLFATFIVAHVYLTTTGHKPLDGIKGMMLGWEEVESHGDASPHTDAPPAGAAGTAGD